MLHILKERKVEYNVNIYLQKEKSSSSMRGWVSLICSWAGPRICYRFSWNHFPAVFRVRFDFPFSRAWDLSTDEFLETDLYFKTKLAGMRTGGCLFLFYCLADSFLISLCHLTPTSAPLEISPSPFILLSPLQIPGLCERQKWLKEYSLALVPCLQLWQTVSIPL